jgi:hypothetical protein
MAGFWLEGLGLVGLRAEACRAELEGLRALVLLRD